MQPTSFHRRGAISAADAAKVAATSVVAPVVHADETYGAIATGQDGHWGISYAEGDQYNVRGFAGQRCGGGCQMVTYFTDWGAFAQSGDRWQGGSGPTQQAATRVTGGGGFPLQRPPVGSLFTVLEIGVRRSWL